MGSRQERLAVLEAKARARPSFTADRTLKRVFGDELGGAVANAPEGQLMDLQAALAESMAGQVRASGLTLDEWAKRNAVKLTEELRDELEARLRESPETGTPRAATKATR